MQVPAVPDTTAKPSSARRWRSWCPVSAALAPKRRRAPSRRVRTTDRFSFSDWASGMRSSTAQGEHVRGHGSQARAPARAWAPVQVRGISRSS